MNTPVAPVDSVALTPIVSWPREAAPGGRYLVSVDLQLNIDTVAWPYPDEEYVVGLMLSGHPHLTVTSLSDTSVVVHRFGGTYGPARFVVAVDGAAATGMHTALWLTLISAGGIPFHTAKLPVTVTREAPVRPPVPGVSVARGTAPEAELPKLTGTGSDAWSMVAVSVNGRPVLALGTDDGTLRLWEPVGPEPVTVGIGRGAVRLAPIIAPHGRTVLIAAAGATMALVDPATGAVIRQEHQSEFEVTALAAFSRPDGSSWIAAGTSGGVIYLMDDSRGFPVHARLVGHTGPVFAMASFGFAGSVLLASAGADSAIRLWDAGSGSLVRSMTAHTAQINDIAVVRGDQGRTLIASASDDGSLRIWDPATGMSTGEFTSRGDWINTVAEVLGSGQQPVLVWGSRDGALWWSGQLTESYSAEPKDRRAVTALTPFGWAGRSTLAIARAGGDVELRETTTFTVSEPGPARADSGTLWDVGIITVLSAETGAVNAMLATARSSQARQHGSGMRFYEAHIEAAGKHINVVATQAFEQGQQAAVISLERLRQLYAPAVVLVVGIAGGIGTAVSPGDVVVATEVISYSLGKAASSADFPRGGQIWQAPAAARRAVNDFFADHGQPYQASIQGPDGTPRACKVVPGPLASGEVLAAGGTVAPGSDVRAYLAAFSDRLLAVDMEAAGIAEAFHEMRGASAGDREWLVIRGIADHPGASKDDTSPEIAAWHAAAVCKQLLPYLKAARRTSVDSEDTGRGQERPHHAAGPVPPMTEVAGDALVAWLPQQRWFVGKGTPIERFDIIADTVLVDGDPGMRHVIIAVSQAGGTDRYQVLVGLRAAISEGLEHAVIGSADETAPAGRTWVAYDALDDPALTPRLLQAITNQETIGPLRFTTEPGISLPTGLGSQLLDEQAGTSVVFGEEATLKVFRRISPGPDPDWEIRRALHRLGSPHVAAPLGALETILDGQPAVLAVLSGYLRAATDGWSLATTSVRDLYAAGTLTAAEVGGDFAGEAHRLGAATAEVHRELAAAFGTDELPGEARRELATQMMARLEAALATVPELAPHARLLNDAFADLAALGEPLTVQRIHGDYHLGQVMRTPTGWVLRDFGGDPTVPLAQRRARSLALRDVAGMLRSFDYAARSTAFDRPERNPAHAATRDWVSRNQSEFCVGYAEAGGIDPAGHAVLLRALQLDRVVYEVVYEARHRPAWLRIPLGSLVDF
jgi:maltokinase